MQDRNGAVEGAEKVRDALLFDLAGRVDNQDGIRGDADAGFEAAQIMRSQKQTIR